MTVQPAVEPNRHANLFALLIGLLIAAMVISIALNVAPLLLSETVVKEWNVPIRPFDQLSSTVVSIAALIAILTYGRELRKWEHEKARHRSEFFFRQAASGLDEVLQLLKDQNNDRVIWVRAGRSLLQAQSLSKQIELEEYQKAYRLYEQKIRNDLYLALTIHENATGHRQPLPPQFFYGTQDWSKTRPLDEVAVEVSRTPEAYRVEMDSIPPQPKLQPLSPSSVVAVFDFLDYPKDYDDPLQRVRLWDGDWRDAFGEKAGAARYVAHSRAKVAIAGKLLERPK